MGSKRLVTTANLNNMKIEKQVVEHWRCDGNGTDPFEITINENSGMVNVKYCYGVHGSTWYGQKGKLKEFLLGCDDYYISQNFFGSQDYFYGGETKIGLKKTINAKFKAGSITYKEMIQARNYVNEEICFEDGYQPFIESMAQHPLIEEIWEYDKENIGEIYHCGFTETVFGHRPNDRFFINKIWPYVRHVIAGNEQQI